MTPKDGTDDGVPVPEPEEAALLGRLQRALEPDDLPPELVEAARAAIEWRHVDEHLAALTARGAATPALAGVRGVAEALAFAGPGWELEVELRAAGGGARRVATGQVVPSVDAVVAWQAPAASGTPVALGAAGLFELDDVPTGPVRFVVTVEGAPPVRTDWVLA
jgi:hypothetical protein